MELLLLSLSLMTVRLQLHEDFSAISFVALIALLRCGQGRDQSLVWACARPSLKIFDLDFVFGIHIRIHAYTSENTERQLRRKDFASVHQNFPEELP